MRGLLLEARTYISALSAFPSSNTNVTQSRPTGGQQLTRDLLHSRSLAAKPLCRFTSHAQLFKVVLKVKFSMELVGGPRIPLSLFALLPALRLLASTNHSK